MATNFPIMPNTNQAYQQMLQAQQGYRQQATGGTSFLQALQAALAGADTQNTALRTQQQNLTGQQFTEPTAYRQQLINEGITDPYKRSSLLNERLGGIASNLTGVQGKLADLGGQRSDVLKTAGGAYDAETAAKLQEANAAGDFFKTLLGQDFQKQQSEQASKTAQQNLLANQKFESRNDPLNALKTAAEINNLNQRTRTSGANTTALAVTPQDTQQMAEDLLSGATAPSLLRQLYGTGRQAATAIQNATNMAQKLAKERNIQWSPSQSEINYQTALTSGKALGSRQTQTQLQIGNAMTQPGGHFDQLQKLTDTLKISGSPLINFFQLGEKKLVGSQDLKNFNALKADLANQVGQFFRGGNAPTDQTTKLAIDAIPNASPRQMQGILSTLRTAMEERLGQYQTPYLTPAYPQGPTPSGNAGAGLSDQEAYKKYLNLVTGKR